MHIRLISSAEILPLEILPASNIKNLMSVANYNFNNDALLGHVLNYFYLFKETWMVNNRRGW